MRILPQTLKLGKRRLADAALLVGVNEQVPFLIGAQRRLREVRAPDDERTHVAVFEEVALRVEATVIDAELDVGIGPQLCDGVGVIEIEIGRREDPAWDAPLDESRERLGKDLDSLAGDERHREVKTFAAGELLQERRVNVRSQDLIVDNELGDKRRVRMSVGIDEARLE